LHIKTPDVESRLLVKCDNRPETVNMKFSKGPNDDGVSVTVDKASAIRKSQGRRIPTYQVETEAVRWRRRRGRSSFSETEASE